MNKLIVNLVREEQKVYKDTKDKVFITKKDSNFMYIVQVTNKSEEITVWGLFRTKKKVINKQEREIICLIPNREILSIESIKGGEDVNS